MEIGVKLKSDFEDYYDYLLVGDSTSPVYNRQYKKSEMTRGKALETLSKLGVMTVEHGAVSMMGSRNRVLVYADPRAHAGEGKLILPQSQAMLIHPNSLCSIWHEDTGGVTYKIVQIGLFRYQFELVSESPLGASRVTNILRLPDSKVYPTGYPIYSIDYIYVNVNGQRQMLATDLNTAQPLRELGVEAFLPAEVVVKEIYNTFIRRGWHR